MASKMLNRLYRRDNGMCHYCTQKCNRTHGSAKQATKEHIVPRSLGGQNALDNYVLACSACNNKRGIQLFFCRCDTCAPLINRALARQKFVDQIFWGLVEHNKVKIRRMQSGRWKVRTGYSHKTYETWAEAMAAVTESQRIV